MFLISSFPAVRNILTGKFPAVLLMLILLGACQRRNEPIPARDIYADLEQITGDAAYFLSSDTNYLLGSPYLKSKDEARSGKYSLKLTHQALYGLECNIPGVKADEHFVVDIWKKGKPGNGLLVVDINEGKFYQATKTPVETDSLGWEHLRIEFFVPPTIPEGNLKVYVWNPDQEPVYFDDLHIVSSPRKEYPEYGQGSLRIFIDSVDMITIQKDRKIAFEEGILETDNSSWVPAILFLDDDEDMMEAKIRLKGDWLDHLYGEKWSFRIRLKKQYAWRHMRTFSIQTPQARDFLNEWVFHRLLDQEDVLTTSYEFMPVHLQDKSLGYYAYEEHFDKNLVESRNRREGPILKLNEEPFWAIQKVYSQTKVYHKLPCFETAVIEPFNPTQTFEDPILYEEFRIAQNLLYEFKYSLRKPSEVFDLEKLARFYALCDITQAWHSVPWNNMRFYYNPILCRLEPIAFDGYTHLEIDAIGKQQFLGEMEHYGSNEIEAHMMMHFNLFRDPLFTEAYYRYLEHYSSGEFINAFMQKIGPELTEYETQIRKEFPYYRYDRQFLPNSAANLRNVIRPYKEKALNSTDYAVEVLKKFKIFTDYDTSFIEAFSGYYVKGYLETADDGSARVRVFNNFTHNIVILGTGKTPQRMRFILHPEPVVPAFVAGKDQSVLIESDTAARFLFFMFEGHSYEPRVVPVSPWPYPTEGNPRRELENLDVFSRDTSLLRDQGKVIFGKGHHEIDEFLVIPANQAVYFEAGCTLDIRNKAGFISYSPVFMQGTEKEPVIITSSDSSAMAFTVIQAKGRCHIENAIFEQLNTLNYEGWWLTGAVNFYESDVDIRQTVFRNNRCEDALNIIRSDFLTDQVTFENTFGDAFDSDFCTGLVTRCTFIRPANDAIDFSGSKIEISDCTVLNAGDKGISGGEKSTLTIRNCSVTGCNIGIASKDLSALTVFDSKIINCNYGMTLYVKKPEYGPSTLKAVNLSLSGVKNKTWIQERSTVILNDTIIPGDKKEDPWLLFY